MWEAWEYFSSLLPNLTAIKPKLSVPGTPTPAFSCNPEEVEVPAQSGTVRASFSSSSSCGFPASNAADLARDESSGSISANSCAVAPNLEQHDEGYSSPPERSGGLSPARGIKFSVPSSPLPCTPTPALLRESEEVEVHSGPALSLTRASSRSSSTSSSCGFPDSTSNAAALARNESSGSIRVNSSAVETSLEQLVQRDEGYSSPPHQTERSGSSPAKGIKFSVPCSPLPRSPTPASSREPEELEVHKRPALSGTRASSSSSFSSSPSCEFPVSTSNAAVLARNESSGTNSSAVAPNLEQRDEGYSSPPHQITQRSGGLSSPAGGIKFSVPSSPLPRTLTPAFSREPEEVEVHNGPAESDTVRASSSSSSNCGFPLSRQLFESCKKRKLRDSESIRANSYAVEPDFGQRDEGYSSPPHQTTQLSGGLSPTQDTFSVPSSPFPRTPTPALSRESEEVEVHNGPTENTSRPSLSSFSGRGFPGSISNAAVLARNESSGSIRPNSSAVAPNFGQREMHEGYSSPPHQTQRSEWSSPARGIKFSVPSSPLPRTPTPAFSREPEEVEVHNGPTESTSRASSSSSSFGSVRPNSSAVEPNSEQLGQREGYNSSPHQTTQHSGWSSPARGVSRAPAAAAAATKSPRGLKEIQLQKLGKLEALDRAWDRWYPNETEERFEWPWGSLSKEQVALGRLDFRKFIVLLSALSQTGLEPENALSLEQINALDSLPLEEIPGYIASEVAVRHKIPYRTYRWLEKDGPVSFECHVDENDVCKYKIVQQRPASTVLHRTFGGDRVMLVFFSRRPRSAKRFQKGICVGLRRYRLWTFKDTGKEEFKDRSDPTEEDYQKAVRGYFVCTESLADIDLDDPNFKYITRIHAARCHIMNIHNVPTMSNYCFRSQLALSQSALVPLNISGFEFECIDDLLSQTLDDKNRPLAFTNGAGEISFDVAKLINGLSPPSLVQHRTYKAGMALKGTFQVNHQLEGLKIRYRPSMRKVDDKNRLVLPIIDDSLEILNTTSRKPRTANLCVDLIILLSLGGVPASFFEQLVRDAIEKIKNIFTDFDLAMEEVQNSDPETVMRHTGCCRRGSP